MDSRPPPLRGLVGQEFAALQKDLIQDWIYIQALLVEYLKNLNLKHELFTFMSDKRAHNNFIGYEI